MKRTFIILLLSFILSGCSDSQPVHAFVKGSFAQIQQTYKNKPHLLVFWSQDCAYCMKEFTFLADVLAATDIKLITISTDSFLESGIIRDLHQTNNLVDAELWVFSDPVAEKLYFDVDKNWRGELPLMFLVNANNIMTKHMGILSQNQLVDWLAQNS